MVRKWSASNGPIDPPKSEEPPTPLKKTSSAPGVRAASSLLWDLLTWHIWGIISLAGSVILLYLNFKEYAIGGELGTNPGQTANILGVLQLAIKAHELAIVASLFAVTSQWIQGSLRDGGILFGLLGTETSSAQPFFIISSEYRAAFGYGISGILRSSTQTPEERKKRKGMFLLTCFLCVICIISSLAGPASGVLMIPRVDWFWATDITMGTEGRVYPHILVQHEPLSNSTPLMVAGLQYWVDVASYGDLWLFMLDGYRQNVTRHRFTDTAGNCYINTSTTPGRVLGSNWAGSTKARSAMRLEVYYDFHDLMGLEKSSKLKYNYHQALKEWRNIKFVRGLKALETQVVCRAQTKQRCGNSSTSSSDWCYMSVTKDGSTGSLRSMRDLLLVLEGGRDEAVYGAFDEVSHPAAWITEGPKEPDNPSFASSVELILELTEFRYGQSSALPVVSPLPMLVVCSVNATMGSAMVTSYSVSAGAEEVEYLVNSNGIKEVPRTLLYYKTWLDSIHNGNATDLRDTNSTKSTYPPRNSSKPTTNIPLREIARAARSVIHLSSDGIPGVWGATTVDASDVETVVAGGFAYFFSWIQNSTNQYTIGGQEFLELTGELIPELGQYRGTNTTAKVYHEGYGYRLSSRTSRLGFTILIAHALVWILGSVWMLCWRREVIKAWGTVLDYTALGIVSLDRTGTFQDSSAGVQEHTLSTLIKVDTTKTNPEKWEIVVVQPQNPEKAGGVGNV